MAAAEEVTRRLALFYQEHNPLKTAVDIANTVTYYVVKNGGDPGAPAGFGLEQLNKALRMRYGSDLSDAASSQGNAVSAAAKAAGTMFTSAVAQGIVDVGFELAKDLSEALDGLARRSSAEHLIATKAPCCTATAWIPHCRSVLCDPMTGTPPQTARSLMHSRGWNARRRRAWEKPCTSV